MSSNSRITIFALACVVAPTLQAAQITIPAGATVQAPGGTIDGGCSALVIAGTANVSAQMPRLHHVTISSGGTFSLANATASVGGNWSNSGTFTHNGNSTVRFVDECATGPASLTGATSFHNLTFISSTGRTFTIPVGSLIQVASTLTITGAIGAQIQFVSANPSQAANIVTAPGATITGTNYQAGTNVNIGPPNPPRLSNISTRGPVLTGDNVLIGGFIIQGSTNKQVVIRARGPSMAQFGVPGLLANPQLVLYSGQTPVASSDNWGDAANAAAITASGFAPENANEAAILTTLAPGPYTAIVTGVGNTTGIAIVEVFEVDAPNTPLINISTRGIVQTGDNVMIGGIIIQGDGPQTVVVRARGPSLAALGVPGTLANPQLVLYSGQTAIASNDNWGDAPNAAAITASTFAPTNPNEAAVLVTLQPGAYTAIVTGVGNTTGIAIVEVFKVN